MLSWTLLAALYILICLLGSLSSPPLLYRPMEVLTSVTAEQQVAILYAVLFQESYRMLRVLGPADPDLRTHQVRKLGILEVEGSI